MFLWQWWYNYYYWDYSSESSEEDNVSSEDDDEMDIPSNVYASKANDYGYIYIIHSCNYCGHNRKKFKHKWEIFGQNQIKHIFMHDQLKPTY